MYALKPEELAWVRGRAYIGLRLRPGSLARVRARILVGVLTKIIVHPGTVACFLSPNLSKEY